MHQYFSKIFVRLWLLGHCRSARAGVVMPERELHVKKVAKPFILEVATPKGLLHGHDDEIENKTCV